MTAEEELTDIITSQKAIDPPVRKRERNPWVIMAIVIIVILLFQIASWSVAIAFEAREDAEHASEVSDLRNANTELRAQVTTLLANYDALSTDCEEAADCTTTTPSPALVERILEQIKIPTPAPGQPGRTPSQAEISAAVLDAVIGYCSGGACDGPPGSNGSDGSTGAPGAPGANGDSIVGPQGPAGTNGLDGTNGTNGTDGRGITSVTCVMNDLVTAFRFTYTDGTTQDVPAACFP